MHISQWRHTDCAFIERCDKCKMLYSKIIDVLITFVRLFVRKNVVICANSVYSLAFRFFFFHWLGIMHWRCSDCYLVVFSMYLMLRRLLMARVSVVLAVRLTPARRSPGRTTSVCCAYSAKTTGLSHPTVHVVKHHFRCILNRMPATWKQSCVINANAHHSNQAKRPRPM